MTFGARVTCPSVQGSGDLHANGSEWANTGAERENLSDFALHKIPFLKFTCQSVRFSLTLLSLLSYNVRRLELLEKTL